MPPNWDDEEDGEAKVGRKSSAPSNQVSYKNEAEKLNVFFRSDVDF